MNYLCQGKHIYELSHEMVHAELTKGWSIFNQLAGSIYKDAIWDDLNELGALCDCADNEVKLGMRKLVHSSPQWFY